MNIQWYCKAFNDLSPLELYKIMQLRNEVFVVEQNCVFQDADNKDEGCLHFMGFADNAIWLHIQDWRLQNIFMTKLLLAEL